MTGRKPGPPEPDPFDELPVCPPGMLQNAAGFPAAPADVPADYPLRISWPGILVDDQGHDEDIESRLKEALAVVWPERSDAVAKKPANYFASEPCATSSVNHLAFSLITSNAIPRPAARPDLLAAFD